MKLLYSLLLSFLIVFCSCTNEEKIQQTINDEIEYFIIERNNHNYIVFYTSDGGVFGMTHDPDCKCYLKQDTISNEQLMKSFIYNILNTPNHNRRHPPRHRY